MKRKRQTSLLKALKGSGSGQKKTNSESSNTSGDDEFSEKSDKSEEDDRNDDSSSGDSMDDGSEPKYGSKSAGKNSIQKSFHVMKNNDDKEPFVLEGMEYENENSNSANENSAENNLENYEVDIENEEDPEDMSFGPYGTKFRRGLEDLDEDEDMMLDDEDFEQYKNSKYMKGRNGEFSNFNPNSGGNRRG